MNRVPPKGFTSITSCAKDGNSSCTPRATLKPLSWRYGAFGLQMDQHLGSKLTRTNKKTSQSLSHSLSSSHTLHQKVTRRSWYAGSLEHQAVDATVSQSINRGMQSSEMPPVSYHEDFNSIYLKTTTSSRNSNRNHHWTQMLTAEGKELDTRGLWARPPVLTPVPVQAFHSHAMKSTPELLKTVSKKSVKSSGIQVACTNNVCRAGDIR